MVYPLGMDTPPKTNENVEKAPVDLETQNPVESGFEHPRDDHKKFISSFFDGPYETAFRRRTRSPEAPDSSTLTDLVNRTLAR